MNREVGTAGMLIIRGRVTKKKEEEEEEEEEISALEIKYYLFTALNKSTSLAASFTHTDECLT